MHNKNEFDWNQRPYDWEIDVDLDDPSKTHAYLILFALCATLIGVGFAIG